MRKLSRLFIIIGVLGYLVARYVSVPFILSSDGGGAAHAAAMVSAYGTLAFFVGIAASVLYAILRKGVLLAVAVFMFAAMLGAA